jgi:hypothetical protein
VPQTGIEQPFLKKRPIFIKEAPNYEPLWRERHADKHRGSDPQSFPIKLVYECCFEGTSAVAAQN